MEVEQVMAMHFKKAQEQMEMDRESGREEHVTGVRRLSEEARDMRNAGRKLEQSEPSGDLDIVGIIQTLRELEAEQRRTNAIAAKKMNQMLSSMRDIVSEIETVQNQARDEEHMTQQAALSGVNRAQQQAEDAAVKSINDVAKKSTEYIDTMVQVAKKRIERLARVTLPDTLFNTLRWVVLMLVLFIVVHVVWQIII